SVAARTRSGPTPPRPASRSEQLPEVEPVEPLRAAAAVALLERDQRHLRRLAAGRLDLPRGVARDPVSQRVGARALVERHVLDELAPVVVPVLPGEGVASGRPPCARAA